WTTSRISATRTSTPNASPRWHPSRTPKPTSSCARGPTTTGRTTCRTSS
ncbi:MAG: hypothetical protein AVDCRST_MAG38-235, partial [uncultured Solirubrobacteraceae bacterium]